jgi:hypothetical protein
MYAFHLGFFCTWLVATAVASNVLAQANPPFSALQAAEGSASTSHVEDGWLHERDAQTGLLVTTKELVLHPQAEPRPALKHRLIPDEFDRLPGNAGVYYLKALGFLEQDSARDKLTQTLKEARSKAEKTGTPVQKVPPYVWLTTAPRDLPLAEVKEYLSLTRFQPEMIRDAALRDRFDMDRNFREVDNPIAYLLPEVQNLRELARTQSVRCRLAIAEDRVDDAIAILGQQFAMARHLGQDEFLISSLVGIAISSIAWNDATYLVQHPKAPNLYWALAAMPTPLVDLRHSMAVERQFFYQQLKVLREVDETPRPAGYWQEFLDRFVEQMNYLMSELNLPSVLRDQELARTTMVGLIAAAYPGARDYLIQEEHLPREQVDAYPTAQVVFLAMVRYHEKWQDEVFKWMYLPVWQVRSKANSGTVDAAMHAEGDKYGWYTMPTRVLLPAIRAARTAEARCDQGIAMLRTVEAIRMYAAAHEGQLPPSLDALPVPAPIEPFTGKTIDYEVFGDRAVLSGHSLPGIRYRFVLRIAK